MSENQKKENSNDWKPTAAFYLSNSRSTELRELSIGIVERVTALFENPEVTSNPARQQQLYAELEHLGGKLQELGIEPEMNVGLPPETFRSDPVVLAEWIAGQLLPQTGFHIPSETEMSKPLQEFNEGEPGKVNVVGLGNLPPRLKHFMRERTVLSYIKPLLDIPTKDSEPEEYR